MEQVREARLRFRPAGGRHWYSVVMEQRGETYAGILPKPKETLSGFDYYIDVIGENLESIRTEEYSPSVAKGPMACEGQVVAATMATAVAAVTGPAGVAGASLVPVGFSASGVVQAAPTAAAAGSTGASGAATGTGASGVSGAAGAAGAAAGGAAGVAVAGAGGAAAGGIGTTTLLVVGGVAAAGAALAATSGGSGSDATDPLDVDDDGFSENQGDCNDANPNASPGGTVTATVNDTQAGLTMSCPGPATAITYSVTNAGCTSVTVQSITHTTNAEGSTATSEYPPSAANTVPPGQTVVVRRIDRTAGDWPCCSYGPCSRGTTTGTFRVSFVFRTNLGDIPATGYEYTGVFGPGCPQCSYDTRF